ncbi:MAG: LysM peptidoglycan-binding domain-containing protein [Legionellales bacterium]
MRHLLLLFCFLLTTTSQALSLKTHAPSRYVVKNGDSLWTIANQYLEHPWEWKTLWHANPKIQNPNRLYAGDVIVLDSYQKTPYLKVLANGTVKLSPKTRMMPIDNAIPTIPLDVIKPFLSESLILDEDVLLRAPYVVAYMGEHMLGSAGNTVYVKGLHTSTVLPIGGTITYSIFRQGKNYTDPLTQKILGYKAALVGYGELVAGGEPATVLLTGVIQGIKKTDRVLINNSPEFDLYYEPTAPVVKVNGYIIEMPGSMPDGNSQEAVGGIVVINLGAQDGLKVGNVLGLYGKLRVVPDPMNSFTPIKLPPERLGEAMIFKTFTKTSFALIVRATGAIYRLDTVTNP